MIKNDVAIGKNRTGIELSPIDKHDVLEVTELTHPSTDGDASEARAKYIEEAEPIGTVPPPASVKGVAKAGVAAVTGVNVSVLIDKLGERLAFERTGARLYEALIEKCEASEPLAAGPTVADLSQIHDEELAHFEIVREAITSLGGDPTAMTPSADIAAVASMGVLQVVSDARTSLRQSLEAILIAELVDNDCWELLITLTRTAGHDGIAARFEEARSREVEHLAKVRRWVTTAAITAEKPATAKA